MTLLDEVQQHLSAAGWDSAREDEAPVLHLRFSGHSGSWDVVVLADANLVVVYSRPDVAFPAERRDAGAELVARANWELPIGNLEVDLEDGEVRFKTSVDVESVSLTQQLVTNLVRDNVAALDDLLPAVRAVAEDAVPPEEALVNS